MRIDFYLSRYAVSVTDADLIMADDKSLGRPA